MAVLSEVKSSEITAYYIGSYNKNILIKTPGQHMNLAVLRITSITAFSRSVQYDRFHAEVLIYSNSPKQLYDCKLYGILKNLRGYIGFTIQ